MFASSAPINMLFLSVALCRDDDGASGGSWFAWLARRRLRRPCRRSLRGLLQAPCRGSGASAGTGSTLIGVSVMSMGDLPGRRRLRLHLEYGTLYLLTETRRGCWRSVGSYRLERRDARAEDPPGRSKRTADRPPRRASWSARTVMRFEGTPSGGPLEASDFAKHCFRRGSYRSASRGDYVRELVAFLSSSAGRRSQYAEASVAKLG